MVLMYNYDTSNKRPLIQSDLVLTGLPLLTPVKLNNNHSGYHFYVILTQKKQSFFSKPEFSGLVFLKDGSKDAQVIYAGTWDSNGYFKSGIFSSLLDDNKYYSLVASSDKTFILSPLHQDALPHPPSLFSASDIQSKKIKDKTQAKAITHFVEDVCNYVTQTKVSVNNALSSSGLSLVTDSDKTRLLS